MGLFEFGEFMEFFTDVIFGTVIQTCSSSGGLEVENKVDTNNLVSSVSSSIRKHSIEVKQDVYSKQDIEITCGGKDVNVNPNLLTYRKHEKNIFGMDKEGTGCVVRGCCPEVNQMAKIRLAAINKNAIKESREMVNKITEQISAETSVTVDGCGITKPTKVSSSVYSETSDQTYEKVRELIEKETDFKYDGSQKVRIHFRSPMICVNNCDEPPRSQSITQEANIEALSRNIVDVISEDIDKKTIENEITTSVSVDSADTMKHMKGVIYSIVTCIIIVLIYVVFYFAALLLLKLILKVPSSPPALNHFCAVLLLYITYLLWGTIRCTIDGGNFFVCIGLFQWIKCAFKSIIKMIADAFGLGPVADAVGAIVEIGTAPLSLLQGKNPIDEIKKGSECDDDEGSLGGDFQKDDGKCSVTR